MSDLTKRALSASLKKMLTQKPLKSITISDITGDCGVNRQTFYYHFQDLADLIEWTCLRDAEEAIRDKRTSATWEEGFLKIFNLMLNDRVFIENIYHSVSLETLQNYLFKLTLPLLSGVVDELSAGLTVSQSDKDFIARFYSFSFVGVVFDWIKDNMKEKPETIVKRTATLISGTIRKALDNCSAR